MTFRPACFRSPLRLLPALLLAVAGPALAAGSGSSSAPPVQYRGQVEEGRSGRRPATAEPGVPVPGEGERTAGEGRDRWEFWFEHEKDALLRAALRQTPVASPDDPMPLPGPSYVPVPPRPEERRDRLLPALRVALLDPSPAVRAAAATALGNAGDSRSLPVLVSEMRGGDVAGRRSAASALGFLGDPVAVPALGEAMNRDPDPEVRSRAALSLGLTRDATAAALLKEALARGLEGEGGNRAEFAADVVTALGILGDRTQVPLLQKVLLAEEIRDRRIRGSAARALGCIGDPAAVPPLLASLKGATDARLRRAVVQALGSFRDQAAAAELRRVLESDPDPLARGLAAVSLARVEGAAAVATLEAMTEAKHSRTVRGFAALALGLTGDPAKAGPAARGLLALRGEDSVRGAAALALGLLRDGRAIGDLLAVMEDSASSPDLRGYALLGAALTGQPSVPGLLRRALLADRPPEVARCAALGAGVLPFPGSDLLLQHVLFETQDPTVRGAALLGLGLAPDRGMLPLLADSATDPEGRAALARLQSVLALGQIGLEAKLPPVARIASGTPWYDVTPVLDEVTRGF